VLSKIEKLWLSSIIPIVIKRVFLVEKIEKIRTTTLVKLFANLFLLIEIFWSEEKKPKDERASISINTR
jgi:hypothetical protein